MNLFYWLKWQVPVCGLLIVGPAVAATCAIKKVKAEPLFLDELWKSKWRHVTPVWLLLFRVVALVCLVPFLYEVVAIDGLFAFYFYTQWTFALVMVYFVLGIAVSAYGCWVTSKQLPSDDEETTEFVSRDVDDTATINTLTHWTKQNSSGIKLQSPFAEECIRPRAGFWGYLMQIVYQASAGAVIFTDIVFWCILVPFLQDPHFSLNLLMRCTHSLNAVFLLLDTSLNSLAFTWFGMLYFVLLSCIYVASQWVLHACGFTWWPYPFLELDTPWAPLWYLGLALVHIPCHGLYVMIVKAKNTVFPKLFPRAFASSQ